MFVKQSSVMGLLSVLKFKDKKKFNVFMALMNIYVYNLCHIMQSALVLHVLKTQLLWVTSNSKEKHSN